VEPAVAAPRERRRAEPVTQVGGDVDEEVRKALGFVLRSSNARPQTEAELRAKLVARDVEPDVADAALAQARRLRAVDDSALAAALVEERGNQRGWGRARMRSELRRRRVPDDVASAALAALDGRDELAVATELAGARFRQLPAALPPEAAARRLVGYLVRRGHPQGLAQRVAREVSGLNRAWD
jgi:regulatory protein